MCQWGTERIIHVIDRDRHVAVDACIADYVQEMNDRGIVTIACCCGHGQGLASVLVLRRSIPEMLRWRYAFENYSLDLIEHRFELED